MKIGEDLRLKNFVLSGKQAPAAGKLSMPIRLLGRFHSKTNWRMSKNEIEVSQVGKGWGKNKPRDMPAMSLGKPRG